jgi:hypothetical protein
MKEVGSEIDPFQTLGVAADANTEQIRQRYLELVKQFPPDRFPEKFSQIRDAYEMAGDSIRRWQFRLLDHHGNSLHEVVSVLQPKPCEIPIDTLLREAERLQKTLQNKS